MAGRLVRRGPGSIARVGAVCAVLVVLPTSLIAGWFADYRLTDNTDGSFTSSNNARCVASDSAGYTHVVWHDERKGSAEIYYKRYDGVVWTADTRLTTAPGTSQNPSVAVGDSGRVFVVWEDNRDGNYEIYFKMFDGAWYPDQRLTSASGSSQKPSMAVDGTGRVHVVWHDYRDGNSEVYYKMFDGVAWGADERLTVDSGASWDASVAADRGSHIHVVWRDDRAGSFGVYYKRYDGAAWTGDERVSPAGDVAEYPSVAAAGTDSVDVVWVTYGATTSRIYHARFDGAAWSSAELVTPDSDSSDRPSVAAAGDSLHVVWQDNRHGDSEVYYRLFDGMAWHGEERLTLYDGASRDASVAVDDSGNAHVVWCDYRDGNPEIYTKQSFHGSWPKPEVVSIDPDSASFGASIHIADLRGTGFMEPAFVWLARSGEPDLVASGVTVESPERITCDIELWAATGLWDVVVKNPDQQADTLQEGFVIEPLPKPEILSVDADSGRANQGVKIADLLGAGFFDPVSVALMRNGEEDIVAFSVVVESPDHIDCDFDLTGAAPGLWDVVAANPDGGKDTLSWAFRVLPAVWSEDTRLTDDPFGSATSRSHARSVETDSEGRVHVVWHDERDGNWEVYYKMRDGDTWTEDQRLTFDPAFSDAPAIAVDGADNLHVVWADTRAGSSQIYYKKCEAGSWSEDECVTPEFGSSGGPSIAAGPGDVLHLAWHDGGYCREEVYYKKFDGVEWGAAYRVSSSSGRSAWPALAVDDVGNLHVFYQEGDFMADIHYRMYTGTFWGGDLSLIASGYSSATDPSAVAFGDRNIHLVWTDSRDGNYEIYYRYCDGGSWTGAVRLTNMAGESFMPQVARDDSAHLHLTWNDHRDGNGEIYYKTYDGLSWGSDQRLTGAPDKSMYPSIAIDHGGGVHVVWHDKRYGNGEIYYKNLPAAELAGMGVIGDTQLADRITAVVPNPARRGTRIDFSLGAQGCVKFSIVDVRGRLVWKSDLGTVDPGRHSLTWDGTDPSGNRVAAGVYFVSLRSGRKTSLAKVVVLR